MPSPYGFIISPSQKRTSAWTWAMGVCAIPPIFAALFMTGIQIKGLKQLHCSIMLTDWINIGLAAATLLIILYPLLSTGPAKPLRFLPFSYPLHLTLILILLVLSGLGCWKSSSPCSDWKTACPAQVKLAGTTQWRYHGKKCDFSKTKARVVRDVLEGFVGAVLEKRKGGGGSGGRKKSNDSKEEEGRFACWIVVMIALAVWFFFELIMFGAEIELQKKRKLAEAEGGAEQTEQLQLPDEEAANAKSYADVETAYQPRSTLPYEPTPAANLAGGRKEGVNVRVNEVR